MSLSLLTLQELENGKELEEGMAGQRKAGQLGHCGVIGKQEWETQNSESTFKGGQLNPHFCGPGSPSHNQRASAVIRQGVVPFFWKVLCTTGPL